MSEEEREAALGRLLDAHVASIRGPLIAWYYTPMMLPFSRHIEADVTVFDAMDELSKFKFAPERLLELEQELIDRADIVFTGGSSLYRGEEGSPRAASTASRRRSTALISARRARGCSTRPTRRTCRSRASASTA